MEEVQAQPRRRRNSSLGKNEKEDEEEEGVHRQVPPSRSRHGHRGVEFIAAMINEPLQGSLLASQRSSSERTERRDCAPVVELGEDFKAAVGGSEVALPPSKGAALGMEEAERLED